jgi:hypothetical protein
MCRGSSTFGRIAAGGRKLDEQKLDALPVFDGGIAAGDRIDYANTDRNINCIPGVHLDCVGVDIDK